MTFHPIIAALGYSLLTLVIAAVVWLFGSSTAAWTTLTLGLALQLGYHLRQWLILERWTRTWYSRRKCSSEWFDRGHYEGKYLHNRAISIR
jgi:hypothetical protein